jgi:RNA polymerase sigma-70 factor (ECF subfamily)
MVMAAPGQLGAWMAAAQRGDHEAYRDLLEAVQPMILGYLRKRIESEAAAEDVTQDVLLTMHRVRHTYDPERPFEPWLFAIARSRLIDHLRRRRRVSAMEVLTDNLPELAATASVETASDAAFEILDRLPATQREAFAMLKLEGLTTEEAAQRAEFLFRRSRFGPPPQGAPRRRRLPIVIRKNRSTSMVRDLRPVRPVHMARCSPSCW